MILDSLEPQRKISAPEGVMVLLRELVHERTGTYFEEARLSALQEKLEPLARERGCQTFLDYYYHLKLDAEAGEEWQRVIEALSVQETYFWRETDQIDALVNLLVPDWFGRSNRPLRIWSAACATGEEPFSIAIALAEAGWLRKAPIEIVASDASVNGLEKARRGIFRERSMRCMPAALRDKYFQPVPQGWCIAPEMLAHVRFHRANIVVGSEIDTFARSPVIFCRNVFIYFSPVAITKTVQQFAERMPAGGHLFVGVSESLRHLTKDFELKEMGKAFVYEKTPPSPGTKRVGP